MKNKNSVQTLNFNELTNFILKDSGLEMQNTSGILI
jgi:hypothetical protein